MQGRERKTHLKRVMQSLQRKMIPHEEWKVGMAALKDSWREKIRAVMDGPGARITGNTAKKFSVTWELLALKTIQGGGGDVFVGKTGRKC
jgi:hypothetical protein